MSEFMRGTYQRDALFRLEYFASYQHRILIYRELDVRLHFVIAIHNIVQVKISSDNCELSGDIDVNRV
jgi:hypothetical protein